MSDLAALWRYIADTSCRGYSPLYDRICRTVADDAEVLGLVSEAPPQGHNPLLLLAAVHYLVLGGLDHPLAAVYAAADDPEAGATDTAATAAPSADPGPLFVDLCLQQRDAILELLATERVNTNEVGRSAVIGPALTLVADRLGAPLAHVDVGCSAGLNLLVDRYRMDYGPLGVTGPVDAAVELRCEVLAGRPPIASTLPTIAARVGLDLGPTDVHDSHQVRWQLACVWPDTGRLDRTRRALEEARRHPLTLVAGDAVEEVGGVIAGLPAEAVAVVTTTWVAGYFSPAQRAGFHDALATASVAGSRPVAWISAEGHGVVDAVPSGPPPVDELGVERSVLGLVTFPGDGRAIPELLGYTHPHGHTLDWRVPPS
ncbi:MAG TPA: DUF2332 domain-containing protein [Acidimicrobiales bacterium]|nr:DUF2332 domain-containing protein [Acidimicrobiales bacterium]